MNMKTIRRGLLSAIAVTASCAMVMAQGPGGAKGKGGPPRPVLSVTRRLGRMAERFPCIMPGGATTSRRSSSSTGASVTIQPPRRKLCKPTRSFSTTSRIPRTRRPSIRCTGRRSISPAAPRPCPRDWDRGSARRDAQWSRHPGRQGHTGLFRTRRRPRAVPSLRVRVLRPGHEAGSAGNRVARRVDEGHGRPRHRQGGVCRPLPRAAAVNQPKRRRLRDGGSLTSLFFQFGPARVQQVDFLLRCFDVFVELLQKTRFLEPDFL